MISSPPIFRIFLHCICSKLFQAIRKVKGSCFLTAFCKICIVTDWGIHSSDKLLFSLGTLCISFSIFLLFLTFKATLTWKRSTGLNFCLRKYERRERKKKILIVSCVFSRHWCRMRLGLQKQYVHTWRIPPLPGKVWGFVASQRAVTVLTTIWRFSSGMTAYKNELKAS